MGAGSIMDTVGGVGTAGALFIGGKYPCCSIFAFMAMLGFIGLNVSTIGYTTVGIIGGVFFRQQQYHKAAIIPDIRHNPPTILGTNMATRLGPLLLLVVSYVLLAMIV